MCPPTIEEEGNSRYMYEKLIQDPAQDFQICFKESFFLSLSSIVLDFQKKKKNPHKPGFAFQETKR